MEHTKYPQFTRFEIARIIGARALQIAMDAPLLIKISDSELKALKYDAISLAERELELEALPIAINRPSPRKRKDKLQIIKEEKVSDDELKAKESEVEKEIVEAGEELGLVQQDETETEDVVGPEEQ